MKSLRHHIKKRAGQHIRHFQVQEKNLQTVINEAADHMKEIFGHMLFTTATSPAGQTASQHNMHALCEAILSSLAMERELHPLLTMFLTYASESPYVADRREDPYSGHGDDKAQMAAELAEVEALEQRFSAKAKSRAESNAIERSSQKSDGSNFNFDFSKTRSMDNMGAADNRRGKDKEKQEKEEEEKKKGKKKSVGGKNAVPKMTLNHSTSRDRKGTGYTDTTENAKVRACEL